MDALFAKILSNMTQLVNSEWSSHNNQRKRTLLLRIHSGSAESNSHNNDDNAHI